MRKFCQLLLLFFLLQNESKSQYHPVLGTDTTTWCITFNYFPVRSGEVRAFYYQQITAHHDTILDTLMYKKTFGVNGAEAYFGAMREDTSTQRVYFIYTGDSTEQLLYDFTLNLGDTFNIDLHNNTYGNMQDGAYIVDSVSWVSIRGGLRKYIRLHNPLNVNPGLTTGQPLKLEWIESVGEIHDPVYTFISDYNWGGEISWTCNFDFETVVLKQTHDTTKNYMNECVLGFAIAGSPSIFISSDTCLIQYGGSINELNNLASISLFPNPSNGQELTIDVNNYALKSDMNVAINDETGRIVYSTKKMPIGNSIKLNDLSLHSGIYFVSLNDSKTVLAKSKLVVTK